MVDSSTEDKRELETRALRSSILKDEKEYAKELFELEFKAIGYLLAANGAGLAGSLSLLKDYNSTPQLKGTGFFIACFAFGFLCAIFSFVAAQLHRSHIMQVFLDGVSKDVDKTIWIVWRALLPQWLSAGSLMIAIFGIIYRFIWL
jgi:hypothetical protein